MRDLQSQFSISAAFEPKKVVKEIPMDGPRLQCSGWGEVIDEIMNDQLADESTVVVVESSKEVEEAGVVEIVVEQCLDNPENITDNGHRF